MCETGIENVQVGDLMCNSNNNNVDYVLFLKHCYSWSLNLEKLNNMKAGRQL